MSRARRAPGAARRGRPLVALVVLAYVPACALAGLWWWADGEASSAATTTTTTTVAAEPAPELTTPLLSWRRTPAPLATRAEDAALRAELRPFLDAIAPTSCAAVRLDGEPVGGANETLPVVPASNQKLLVAAVALDVLGPDHRFRTEVRGGPIGPDGVLTGDLYVVGGGDPLLASADLPDDDTYPAFDTTSYDALADQLVAAGLVRITGDVVGDGSRYDDEFVVPSWGPDITRDDGGPVDALLVNDGRIRGSGVGLNPNQAAAGELNRLLVARGVTIDGRNRNAAAPPDLPVLAAVESVPLSGVVRELLVNSDNNTAEMLVKEIGLAGAGQGTRVAGLEVVRQRLAEWGVPLDGVVLDDGSGLSRQNRLTCAALVEVLARAPDDGPLLGALPVAGVDGTLQAELVDTPAVGAMRAKTGTLTDVKAITGRLPAEDGARFDVALVLNEPGISDRESAPYRATWASLVAVLDGAPFGPTVDELAPR